MRQVKVLLCVIFFLSMAAVGAAEPISRRPLTAPLVGVDARQLARLVAGLSQRDIEISKTNPIRLRAFLVPLGLVDLRLHSMEPASDNCVVDRGGRFLPCGGELSLLEGSIVYRARGLPGGSRKSRLKIRKVAASVGDREDGSVILKVAFNDDAPRVARFYGLEAKLQGRGAQREFSVSNVPGYVLVSRSLAKDLAALSTALPESLPFAADAPSPFVAAWQPSQILEIETAVDCDYQCRVKMGGTSAARQEINQIVLSVNQIYTRDLKFKVKIANNGPIIRENPYPDSPYPSGLVTADDMLFKHLYKTACHNATGCRGALGWADVYHLLTGSNLTDENGNDLVIGYGWTGTVCSDNNKSMSIAERFGSLTYYIMAHEIGHNLGAGAYYDPSLPPDQQGHDPTGGLMGPTLDVNNPQGSFHQWSINQIYRHFSEVVAAGKMCLSAEGSSPSPTPTPKASRTPDPGATPTPTPRGGGGGSIGDPGSNTSYASLNASYRSGVFTAKVTLPGQGFSGNCRVDLKGATTRIGVKTGAKTLGLSIIAAGSSSVTLRATGVAAVRPPKPGSIVKAFVGASLSCDTGGALWSVVKGVKIDTAQSRTTGKGAVKNARAWLNALARKL